MRIVRDPNVKMSSRLHDVPRPHQAALRKEKLSKARRQSLLHLAIELLLPLHHLRHTPLESLPLLHRLLPR